MTVTIMGESHGAVSVGHLVNTFADNPPFRAAIEMSGSAVALAGSSDPGGQATEAIWPQVMAGLNCTNSDNPAEELSCARSASASDILAFLDSNGIRGALARPDNVTALARPDIAWSTRNIADVPLLIGSTAHEASFWVVSAVAELQATTSNASVSDDGMPSIATFLEAEFNLPSAAAATIQELYAPGSAYYSGPNDTFSILTAILTDYTFRCTSSFVANLTSSLLRAKVWQYDFTATAPSTTFPEYPGLGAWHSSELGFVFGTYNRSGKATEVDAKLSRSMQDQFGSFVRDPSGDGPGWASFPMVAALGVDGEGEATTIEVDGSEYAPVCQLFSGLYLQDLPALAAMAGSGGGSTPDDSATAEQDEQADATSNGGMTSGHCNAALVLGAVSLGVTAFL
jgi:carboxylesterase type B